MITLTDSVTSLAKAGATLFSRIAGYVLLGLLLNLFLLIQYWSSVAALWSSAATLGVASPALLRLAGALTLLTVMASPVIYFIVGKKQGMSAAIFYIACRQKGPVLHFILTRFFDKCPDLLADLDASRTTIQTKLGDVHAFVEKQTYLVRLVLGSFLSKIDFVAEMDKAITAVEQSGLSGSAKIEMLSTEISRSVTLDDLQPGFAFPALIIAVNIGLVWLVNQFSR